MIHVKTIFQNISLTIEIAEIYDRVSGGKVSLLLVNGCSNIVPVIKEEFQLKLKGKIIAVVSVALLASVAILAINYNGKVEEQNTVAKNEIKQKEAEQKVKEDTEETDKESSTNSEDSTLEGSNSNAATNVGAAVEVPGAGEAVGDEAAASDNSGGSPSTAPAETSPAETSPATQPANGGLHFATREEAIAFGFSRFSAEEIEIYNRASANGLTPEQEALAIQMAYSRFTPEEIAALEEALK